jgi:hypothetical protein
MLLSISEMFFWITRKCLDELTHWCLLEIVILSEAKDLLLVDRQQRAHRIFLTPITIRIRARLWALANGLHPFK